MTALWRSGGGGRLALVGVSAPCLLDGDAALAVAAEELGDGFDELKGRVDFQL